MVQFNTTILKFDDQGEKTGWTYIKIPAEIANQLKPGHKKTFRVKGKLDNHVIKGIALLPMGGGDFIMALNAAMRKGIGKRKGAVVKVRLEADDAFRITAPPELTECMDDEPVAKVFFEKLTPGHQAYFIKWIESAKTEETKAKRIADTITACLKGQDYGAMLRSLKQKRIN